MHTPESASPSKRVRLCRGLLKALLFLWGTLIVTTGVGTLANYFNDPVGQNESSRSVFAHLVIGRLLLSYPIPIVASGTLLLLVTGLSWLGSRESSAPASSSHQITTQDRQRLLKRLHIRYTQLRDQSLQGAVEMELGFASRPAALANATSLAYRHPAQPDRLLPPQTTIVEVYTQAQEELLILGEPGTGKSTLILQLAQHLLTQPEQDENQPIPVLLPLSTWAIKRPLLQDWISDEFARLYDIPKKLSIQWIEAQVILPLLDGLDEMAEDARPACIAAINAYYREHLRPLVVCSRTDEYEQATTAEQLSLHTAVVVQPLSTAQVDAHLAMLGKPLAALRSTLRKNETLATLATTPLMLQILLLTYQGTAIRQLSHKKEELEQQIWAMYVQQMVERKGNAKKYPHKQTVSWLHWLAQSMRDHNQTIFSLENLQPNVLPSSHRILYAWSVYFAVGPLGGLIFGLLGELIFGLLGGLIFGLLGILRGGRYGKIELTERIVTSWKLLLTGLFGGLIVGLFGGLQGLLFGWLLGGQMGELLGGLRIWLLGLLLGGLIAGLQGEQLTERQNLAPNEGIRRSLLNGVRAFLIAGLLFGLFEGLQGRLFGDPFRWLFGLLLFGLFGFLFFGLLFWLLVGLFIWLLAWLLAGLQGGLLVWLLAGLQGGLLVGLFFGLLATIQHYMLRIFLWRTHLFPLNAVPFLEDATTRILLRRVGGSYRFTHRLLLDYFADLDPSSPPSSQP